MQEILKDIFKEIQIIKSIIKGKGSVNAALMDEISKRAIFQSITNIAVDMHEKLDDETRAIFQEKDLKFSKDTRNFIAHNNKATNLKVVRNFINFELVRIEKAISLVFQKEQNISPSASSNQNPYSNFFKLKKSFVKLFSYIVALFFIFCGYLFIKDIRDISGIDIAIWLCFIPVFILFGVTAVILRKREKSLNATKEEAKRAENKENQQNGSISISV